MNGAKNLWSEKFSRKADETLADFNSSFKFDRRLFAADLRASAAHCESLFHAGVLTRLESEKIKNGLLTILKRADYDKNYFDETEALDIYSFIEARLIQLIGDTGRKLHTGRSRSDQAATAFRLWLREEIVEISAAARSLQKGLLNAAERQREAVLPGYAHLRRAQPILWAHWCMAYFEMLDRDRERLDEAWRRVNVLPLGSGELAGTSIEIDRESVARELGFEGVSANSLDAVGDRDFAIEFVGACALLMMHLSRFSEDLILYASSEFQFVELGEAVSNDSTVIPQKKNPGALELIRGKAGRIFGHQTALLTMMKGLPIACNQDLQEDKEAVFDTVDTTKTCLRAAEIILQNLRVREDITLRAATSGYLNANELIDYLVQKSVPFRTAQNTVGKIIFYAVSVGRELNDLSLAEMQNYSEHFEKDVFDALSLEQTLATKNQIGGTSPERVFEALGKAKMEIEREEGK